MARLSKFGGEAGGLTVRILGERWVDLSLEDSIRLSGERMEKLIEHLRGVVDEGQVTIEAKSLHFSTGAKLLEYVEEIKAQLPRNEVQPFDLSWIDDIRVNLSAAGFDLHLTLLGEGFIIVAALMFSLGAIYGKRLSADMEPATMTGWQ